MIETLVRIGTVYIPVSNLELSCEWYVEKLGAKCTYQDEDKAILNLANMSIFLVRAMKEQSANFIDSYGNERFSITFEVNGIQALETMHEEFIATGITAGDIEDRGHSGRNFVFMDLDGNKFDVWSELSPSFKKLMETGDTI
ncbi:VOC family protein [Solibacillus sp. CAU 1738]|uniref:VOC family protein n=1 Tax=Solibacillus sp. CAU 1738 TaxID=3140363 RepID=UPI00325FF1DD